MSLDSLDSMQIIDDRVSWYDYDGVLWTEDASAAEAQEEIRAEVSKRLGFEVILLCVSDGNGHMVWRWQKSRVQDAAEAHEWLLLLGLDLSGVADAQVLRVARSSAVKEMAKAGWLISPDVKDRTPWRYRITQEARVAALVPAMSPRKHQGTTGSPCGK